uniref:Uncharacterized protein n=1 Tax=Rhizophora mucronata TaxID=61149 RepID=A0A2P2LDI4_RHIMU
MARGNWLETFHLVYNVLGISTSASFGGRGRVLLSLIMYHVLCRSLSLSLSRFFVYI